MRIQLVRTVYLVAIVLCAWQPAQSQGNCRKSHAIIGIDDQDRVGNVAKRIPHLARKALAEALYNDERSAASYSSEPPPFVNTRTKVIVDPQEGLLAKVLAIRNAKHTVDFTTFILKNDESGKILLNEIQKAYERGVSIRLMADSSGSLNPFHLELKALFNAEPGFLKDKDGNITNVQATIEIKSINSIFHPRKFIEDVAGLFDFLRRPEDDMAGGNRWRNRRSHDKVLLVDAEYGEDAVAILGGRNVSNSYYGVPEVDADTYHDMEVMVRSGKDDTEIPGFAEQILSHYERLFYHKGNKKLNELPGPMQRRLTARLEDTAEVSDGILSPKHPVGKKLKEMTRNDYMHKGFEDSRGFFVNQIENLMRKNAFFNPDPETNERNRHNGSSITDHFTEMVQSAKTSIDIVSPYLYLYPNEMKYLRDWLRADPKRRLRIITNSIYSADNVAAQALTDREVGPKFNEFFSQFGDRAQFLTYGRIDANDLGGDAHYGKVHSKFAVIDGNTSLVTSSNGDPRSRYLNSELGFVIEGEKTAADLLQEVEVLANGSYQFGTREWEELRAHPVLKWKMRMQNVAYPVIKVTKARGTI